MEINAELVKKLREKTGVGLMDCKEALKQSKGDMEKAIEYLREKGLAKLQKRTGRAASEGVIASYIHTGGKIGVLVEVNCETDFAANSKDFQEFAKDIAMQITAANPLYVKREDVPEEVKEKEKNIYRRQAIDSGKPEKIVDRIAEGKMEKFYQEVCLMEQSFIKNPDITIKQLLEGLVVKIGENIVIRRFVRFQLGETSEG
ncbi:MAG TPA: translation elongation factor Ts [Syntrophorhabdaceae bacterium]|nr:translation elongation factor Ts [Syntrophorhabdaceae bacterium]HOL05124.1 translation elongation factor Ts [Syntrophorhabdaceae bacterium]HON84558.1 translation elongation factor Ts [Syntrophorhabdaceae bacterium]HOT41061.1 translation elongation factor Ts [Syntrophorhabdaceae bacterium]HPC66236.1 translation elongation factor Ts [Syntrophorhabdaceae bacterium]